MRRLRLCIGHILIVFDFFASFRGPIRTAVIAIGELSRAAGIWASAIGLVLSPESVNKAAIFFSIILDT
jgi:hypothetical protein